ncbi:sugar phosphate nucleotidyltransferase [Robertkochia aurantiaca]|uniref:sugar phosphate nucleotidyltransferase n=1 Tax=Robertkochia aurantiaca TaxID=2873700 RepID=UPI001CCD54D0|nr:sugar phosphate nucleotidyltransferase [Robertkochia sp. 3YJGBD-33]
MSHDKLIILAGGASSRMKKSQARNLSEQDEQAANTLSKGLIPLGGTGKPLLDFIIQHAIEAGYKTIYLVTGENDAAFRKLYGHSASFQGKEQPEVRFARQVVPPGRSKSMGTADALLQCMEQHQELQGATFTVCNSDNLYSVEVLKALKHDTHENALIAYDRAALRFDNQRIARFALMRFDELGFLTDIIEKPNPDSMDRYRDSEGVLRVSMNIFRFSGEQIWPFLKACPLHPVRDEKEIPTALLNLVAAKPGSVYGIPVSEHVPDLTSKEDLEQMRAYLNKKKHEDL